MRGRFAALVRSKKPTLPSRFFCARILAVPSPHTPLFAAVALTALNPRLTLRVPRRPDNQFRYCHQAVQPAGQQVSMLASRQAGRPGAQLVGCLAALLCACAAGRQRCCAAEWSACCATCLPDGVMRSFMRCRLAARRRSRLACQHCGRPGVCAASQLVARLAGWSAGALCSGAACQHACRQSSRTAGVKYSLPGYSQVP
jgi:hypothetical protein